MEWEKNGGGRVIGLIITTGQRKSKKQEHYKGTEKIKTLKKCEMSQKMSVEAETRVISKTLKKLLSEREKLEPLLGMNWLPKLNRTIQKNKHATSETG